ncbi:response regulator [Amylibacter sp. SFDW26]|uniref:ATP-binding protein n=1 Tax=Amylibacter sp. SFDW26 TaxID=2652722 RepID=UPI00126276E6|nr:ATP-binding protein [Amylibacter sp. SFDW26]KAB7615706.1 response regulator [Amylibacter sp. SFDW26]
MTNPLLSLLSRSDDKGLYEVSKASMARVKIRTLIIGGLTLIVFKIYPTNIVLFWVIPLMLVDLINIIIEKRIITDHERDQKISKRLRVFFLFISWMESICIAGIFIHLSLLTENHTQFIPYVVILSATIYIISTMFHDAIFLFGHLLIHNSAIIFIALRDVFISSAEEKGTAWAEFFASIILIFFTIDIARYFYRNYQENNRNEEKLNTALKHAQELTQFKSDLLSTVGHELRTPLNGILGFSRIMKTTELSSKQGEYINLIEDSGKNLNLLLSNIMDSEAIERGQFLHNPIETNIPRLLYRLQKTFEAAIQDKEIDIILDISSNFPNKVMIDETRLGQCVSNLMSNAIRFTNKGKITLRACIIDGTSSSKLHISVTDTGVGISEPHKAKIFDKFFKADNQILPAQGTGLGLWLIRNIAQAMNGELNLLISSDSGSQFELTFNINNDDINAPKNIGTLANKRILHIEDTKTNLILVRILLEDKEATVIDANTGAKALRLLENYDFDIILCDLQLPDYDGNTLLNDIRKLDHKNATVPIIALTAQPEKILKAGPKGTFDTILSKPVDSNLLLSTLLKLN